MFTDDITCKKVLKKSMNHQKAICPLSERFTEISLEKYSKSEIKLFIDNFHLGILSTHFRSKLLRSDQLFNITMRTKPNSKNKTQTLDMFFKKKTNESEGNAENIDTKIPRRMLPSQEWRHN